MSLQLVAYLPQLLWYEVLCKRLLENSQDLEHGEDTFISQPEVQLENTPVYLERFHWNLHTPQLFHLFWSVRHGLVLNILELVNLRLRWVLMRNNIAIKQTQTILQKLLVSFQC